jgi:hypothetical protein
MYYLGHGRHGPGLRHRQLASFSGQLRSRSWRPLESASPRGRRRCRARYDADKTIAAFAARLKDTVDLDSVRDDLAGVAYRALEPAHVSVWINEQG